VEEYEIPFIVLEGLDASGKTTQAHRLTRFLQSRSKTFCLRVHPSNDNFFGLQTQQFLHSSGKSAHFASALFYMLDVFHSVLQYSWREYNYIIFVRYLLGTAYLPTPIDKVAYYFFATILPKPEKLFFIDVNPEVAYERIMKRNDEGFEMFEKPESLQKIRAKGLKLAIIGKWLIIDGEKSVKNVELIIRNSLELQRQRLE
jgi:dTMP kinase